MFSDTVDTTNKKMYLSCRQRTPLPTSLRAIDCDSVAAIVALESVADDTCDRRLPNQATEL